MIETKSKSHFLHLYQSKILLIFDYISRCVKIVINLFIIFINKVDKSNQKERRKQGMINISSVKWGALNTC